MGTTKTLTIRELPFGFAVSANRWVIAVGHVSHKMFVVGIKPRICRFVPFPIRTMQVFGYVGL